MQYGLTQEYLQNIKSVLEKCVNLHSAILYGSRAKGNFKAGSDIDLTLLGDKLNYKDLVSISLELDDLLLPYEFDLSIYNDINNKNLLLHINRVGVELYNIEPRVKHQ